VFLALALGNLDALASRVTNRNDSIPSDEAIEAILVPRLQALKAVCQQYGVRLIVLLPAVLDSHEKTKGALAACRRQGIPALLPYVPGELQAAYFRDGFHLNAAGEELFTARFCGRLLTGTL
jgi:lysophospholipase L1-like esterase